MHIQLKAELIELSQSKIPHWLTPYIFDSRPF